MKKIIFKTLFFLCFSSIIYSQEFTSGSLQLPALFLPDTEMFSLSPMAYSPEYPASFGGKLGYGLLNLFFGLGSYLANDWGWGIGLTLWQGLGFAGFLGFGWNDLIGGTFFNGFEKRGEWAGWGALGGLTIMGVIGIAGLGSWDISFLYWTIGVTLTFGLVGFCAPPLGENWSSEENMFMAMVSAVVWVSGVIFGIVLPFTRPSASPNEKSTARMNDLRNWNIGIVPASDGHLAGRIVFTAHF
ncbi:MAG: hypothetical protein FWB86_11700 [Treponema sp.]|nr:hypothetical protein [Treponema sp.]